MEKQWYVYILETADGSYYTGATVDVQARLAKHNAGKGSKYVRNRCPAFLRWFAALPDKVSAFKMEYDIKQLSRKNKELIIKEAMVSISPDAMDKIKAAKDEFIKQYKHLMAPAFPGGINGIGIGISDTNVDIGIVVYVEKSMEVFNQIPDTFMGQFVHKKMIGTVRPL